MEDLSVARAMRHMPPNVVQTTTLSISACSGCQKNAIDPIAEDAVV